MHQQGESGRRAAPAKVERLKRAVKDGSYAVDAERLADAMLSDADTRKALLRGGRGK